MSSKDSSKISKIHPSEQVNKDQRLKSSPVQKSVALKQKEKVDNTKTNTKTCCGNCWNSFKRFASRMKFWKKKTNQVKKPTISDSDREDERKSTTESD